MKEEIVVEVANVERVTIRVDISEVNCKDLNEWYDLSSEEQERRLYNAIDDCDNICAIITSYDEETGI
jgi:hypothetical protein